MRVVVECPAKINLFLSVGPKEASGYHPIRTIMQAVGLCDTLTITTGATATAVRSSWIDLPAENTLTKALRLVGELVKVPPVDVYLEKRIPAESGLGGGSSDAAGLLRGLQKVLVAPLPDHTLFDIAGAIGMDVPFFLVGGKAAAEGYGERLSPLPDATPQWVVVVKPLVGCPTASAYAALDAATFPFLELPENVGFPVHNDFERVAPCECVDLIEMLRVYGAGDAGLSGSGSAVFGLFEDHRSARAAEGLVRAGGYHQCWTVRTLSRAESISLQ